ncbi:MAG: hypothetical protein WA906_07930, partial [Pacificimonas sp.]
VANTGGTDTASNSVSLTDLLPQQIQMFTGDVDGIGSGPVGFVDNGTGLTCCAGQVSLGTGSPVAFGASGNGSYDDSITGVRINPDGTLPAYTEFSVIFRVKID